MFEKTLLKSAFFWLNKIQFLRLTHLEYFGLSIVFLLFFTVFNLFYHIMYRFSTVFPRLLFPVLLILSIDGSAILPRDAIFDLLYTLARYLSSIPSFSLDESRGLYYNEEKSLFKEDSL